jgi:4'-phosphopantetheinyl transferase
MRPDGVSAFDLGAAPTHPAAGVAWVSRYRLGDGLPDLTSDFVDRAPRPVTVWLTAPRPAHGVAEAWMSDVERGRLATMQHPRARAEFLTGRWLLRGLLGAVLGCPPARVPLAETAEGALRIDGGGPVFNLSHTEGLVAVAIAAGGELGVDVEWTGRPGRTVELAERYFAVPEREGLLALPREARSVDAEDQRARFFALWTLKEAYIKARGLGLRIPLHSFAFDLEGAHPTVATAPASGDRGANWRFFRAGDGPAHALAVAWRPAP